MKVMRGLLLAASQNKYLRDRAARYGFVRKSVSRFMPGENLSDAMAAARQLKDKNIATVVTHLGENVSDAQEAQGIAFHYLEALKTLRAADLDTEISVKLTQLGLDLSSDLCENHLRKLFQAESPEKTLWIDMEASGYVDVTLTIYRKVLADFPNAGICLQAYLYRTAQDVTELLPRKPSIRLVKGAYSEPPAIALQEKAAIDKNYLELAKILLSAQRDGAARRAAFATHDSKLITEIALFATAQNIPRNQVEVQMLYGIQRAEQERLAAGGWHSGVLIAYGSYWYPWFVRRLAERPANVWLLLKNLGG